MPLVEALAHVLLSLIGGLAVVFGLLAWLADCLWPRLAAFVTRHLNP
jgi:hypothetical protein